MQPMRQLSTLIVGPGSESAVMAHHLVGHTMVVALRIGVRVGMGHHVMTVAPKRKPLRTQLDCGSKNCTRARSVPCHRFFHSFPGPLISVVKNAGVLSAIGHCGHISFRASHYQKCVQRPWIVRSAVFADLNSALPCALHVAGAPGAPGGSPWPGRSPPVWTSA